MELNAIREQSMSDRELILQQALTLSPDDRAYVATALEDSLAEDGDPMSSAEFLAELQRRSAAFRAGTTTARPAKDVLADLRQRQTGGEA
jgi:putative addiction module component (TIGR02574 family)